MALNRRLLVAFALFLALAGGSFALATTFQGAAGAAGAYPVTVLGPDGTALLDATVEVDSATALTLLEKAAGKAGLALEKESFPGMGTYVRAIGPHRAEGATGWIYEVRVDGEWVRGDRSAEFYPVEPGQALRWRWSAASE